MSQQTKQDIRVFGPLFIVFLVIFSVAALPLYFQPQPVYGAAAVFTNNGAGTANIFPGQNLRVGLDITLPPVDADVFVDGNGGAAAGGNGAGVDAGLAVGQAFTAFVAGDNMCADTVTAVPTILFWDPNGDCDNAADMEDEVEFIGANNAADGAGPFTNLSVAGSLLVYEDLVGGAGFTFDATDAGSDDIYLDVDDSQLGNADRLDAVTVRNLGTAVDTTDITTVQLWADNGNAAFGDDDTVVDAACAWDGVDDWECDVDFFFSTQQRIYITYNVPITATIGRTVQMQVADVGGNGDGKFDTGEAGIWFSNSGAPNTGNHDSNAITVGDGNDLITNGTISTIQSAAGGGSGTAPPPTPDNPPNAPTNIVAVAGENEVVLTWKNTQDADFASVTIYRSLQAGDLGTVIASGVAGETYTDTGLSGFTTYYYTVRSVDAGGNESTNTVQVSATPTGEPAAPPPPAPPSGQVTPESSTVVDGDLVRAVNTVEVYVTKKVGAVVVIRHLVNPRIFDLYGHFGGIRAWDKVIEVNSLGSARVSAWVRGSDGKVWEVNADGTRHWMRMTWDEFASRVASGDSSLATNLIFEVNDAELNLYTVGADVLP